MVILKKSLLESCVFDQQVLKWADSLPVTLDFKVGWGKRSKSRNLFFTSVTTNPESFIF